MNDSAPQDKLTPPKAGTGDRIYAFVSSGMKLIPGFGDSAAEILHALIKTPLERRRAQWEEDFIEVIRKLDARGVDVAGLFQDELFVDNLLQVYSVATKNSQRDKRDALRNALLNCGLPGAPTEIKRGIFIRLIDELGPLHLKLLSILRNPPEWFRQHNFDYSQHIHWNEEKDLLNAALPGSNYDRELSLVVFNDLYLRGLSAHDPSPQGIRYVSAALSQPSTTNLGNEFLDFICEPAGSM